MRDISALAEVGNLCVRIRHRGADPRGLPTGYQLLLDRIPVVACRETRSLRVGRKRRRASDHERVNHPLPDGEQTEIGRRLANLDQPWRH